MRFRRKASDCPLLGRCCAFSSSGNPFCFGDNSVFRETALQSPSDIPPMGGISGFFSMSKSVCADCEDDSASVSRYMDAAMRREKGRVVFIQAQR